MALPSGRAFAEDRPHVRAPSVGRGPFAALLVGLAGICVLVVAARFLAAPLDRFDEGLILTKGALVAGGLVPYRDFWTTYGPLDSLLLGAAFHIITPDVLVERILAIAATLTFSGAAYLLLTVMGVRGALRLLMTSLFALVPLSIPALNSAVLADLLLLFTFTTFLRGQPDARWRWPLLTGALTALASFARPELAAALGIGLLAGYLATARLEGRRSPLLGYLFGVSIGVALLWGPMLLRVGPGPILFPLLQYPLTLYAKGRSIPLGQGHEGPAVAALACAYALSWSWAVVALARRRFASAEVAAGLAFLVCGIGLLGWVLTRADGAHALTAWPATGTLLVLLMQQRRRGIPLRPRVEGAMSIVALVGLALAALGLTVRDLGRPAGPDGLPGATLVGARAWMPSDRLTLLIGQIDARVPAGRPIFVGLRRNDLVLFNDTTLYFLSGRPPGTVYFEAVPGFSNRDDIERTIICQLARSHVTLAVLGPNTPGEPWNLSSQPGSPRLDAWLADHTIATETTDPYQLVTLRQDPFPLTGCP